MRRAASILLLVVPLALAAPGAAPLAPATGGPELRLKDLVAIEGVRENQLIGYGLVVGLARTGDSRQTLFSAQSLTNLLERMGLAVSPAAIQVTNTAAVLVTATLPAFAQPGVRIDVTAAAIGDARSLQGGILVLTSLRGGDGQVYAMAQGPVVTGGFSSGRGGSSQSVNHPTVGRAPAGAIVERPAPSVAPRGAVRLQLLSADFTNAGRIAAAVNQRYPAAAHADNPGLVTVAIPPAFSARPTEFVSELENLTVDADRRARVVLNERTGTIVLGKDVRVQPVAILHGNLSVEIRTTVEVSQPGPLSQGTTQAVPQTSVSTREEKARSVVLPQGATVEELVRALAAIGSTPRDIIAILQNLHSAGALDAEIVVL